MAFLKVNGVAVRGMAAAVPREKLSNREVYEKWGDAESFVKTTGVSEKRVSNPLICSSDLCYESSQRLMAALGWEKDSIDALVFVSQTPDYRLPATSCLLQQRLGLPNTCLTLDISLGCSGWVYGMSVISTLMQNGTIHRGLLLAGDTVTKACSLDDKSTYPLFGDAGTCTALEFTGSKEDEMNFLLYTDGSGADVIMVKEGGFRNPVNDSSFLEIDISEGIRRKTTDISMEGMSVFTFGISKAPKSVRELLNVTGKEIGDFDCFTFHQANLIMNEKIRQKLKLPPEKVPYSMDEFGNTSCASIPLTLVTRKGSQMSGTQMSHIACGFGVGLSWGVMNFDTDHICVPPLIEI